MENSENPKRCGWSIVRKAQVVGVLVGTFGSFVFLFLGGVLPESPSDGMPGVTFPMLIGELISLPTHIMFQALGLKSLIIPPPSSDPNTPIKFILTEAFSAALINGIILFLVGTFIGRLIQKLKTKN